MRLFSLAHVGTFEVENYGDLLFPLILQKELSSRISDITYRTYAPLDGKNTLPIFSKEYPHHFAKDFPPSAIVIGGGDIISFDPRIASCYCEQWNNKINPHSACWAIPGIFRPSGVPLVWNAPGIPYPFTADQAFFVRSMAEEVDYLTVRDEISLIHLHKTDVQKEITIVPDTCCLLSKHYSSELLKERAQKILDPLKLRLREALVFQAHLHVNEDQISELVYVLKQLKQLLNRPILLLPIGYCHKDDVLLSKIQKKSKDAFIFVENKLDPLSIAAVIAHAGCFLGTSLHGNITAFSYGVPFIIYNAVSLAKLNGFAHLIDEQERHTDNLQDILGKYRLLNASVAQSTLHKMTTRIEAHFDKMSVLIQQKSSFSAEHRNHCLLMQYLEVIHELRHWKCECETMKNSKTWKIASLLKKSPFSKRIGEFIINSVKA